MTTEAVALPPKVLSPIIALANVFPVRAVLALYISISGHVGHAQYGVLVCDVGDRNLIRCPSGRIEEGTESLTPGLSYHRIND
jgi:hypothetical protein